MSFCVLYYSLELAYGTEKKNKGKRLESRDSIVFGDIPFEAIDEGELRYMTFNLFEGMAKYYNDYFEEYLKFLPKKKR